jgi:hypothetical protein
VSQHPKKVELAAFDLLYVRIKGMIQCQERSKGFKSPSVDAITANGSRHRSLMSAEELVVFTGTSWGGFVKAFGSLLVACRCIRFG